MGRNKKREYRLFDANIELRNGDKGGEDTYIVEGYASTFDPYVLFTDEDGQEYKEQIDKDAFKDADMSDVVLRVDHEGMVFARTSNKRIELSTDDHGLKIRADLSATADARNLYEHIKAGDYPKMSFAFTVPEGGDEYSPKAHTRTIKQIAKVFDISPVSFPANPGTELDIATRDYFNGVIEAEKAERLEAGRMERKKKINMLYRKLLLSKMEV